MTPRLVCPSCQCAASRRYCRKPQIRTIICLVPHHAEGRFAIVTDVGSGMRWTRYVTRRRTYRVRRSRMVLAPRRWRQVGDDASHHADDGGKRARSPGRLRISRRTIAQGMPAAPAEPVVLPRAFCCTRTMGAARTRHSLRPLTSSRAVPMQNSDPMRRENAGARPHEWCSFSLSPQAGRGSAAPSVRQRRCSFSLSPFLRGEGGVRGSLREHSLRRVPLTPPSQSELCSSRPRKRGERAHRRPCGKDGVHSPSPRSLRVLYGERVG